MQSMDEGLDTPDEFRWNIEIYFGRPNGTWNMYRTYIPYVEWDDNYTPRPGPGSPEYNDARNTALVEFDSRDDIQAIEIAFRDIYSINLEPL